MSRAASADFRSGVKCLCDSGRDYATCCGRWHAGDPAPTAEDLMRSRYSAYVLKLDDYVLQTWHSQTRPTSLSLSEDATKWLGLSVTRHETVGDTATVEFVARFRVNGRGARMHEISEFVREDGRWFYVRGELS